MANRNTGRVVIVPTTSDVEFGAATVRRVCDWLGYRLVIPLKVMPKLKVALSVSVLFLAAALPGCGAAVEAPEEQQAPVAGPCAVYGSAPQVTTIRTPVSADAPHPDCIAQDELSAAGQRVYCCMGADFDAWYSHVGGPAPAPQ